MGRKKYKHAVTDLFCTAKMYSMQWSKPSKKTDKVAEQNTAPVSESENGAELKSKPRTRMSSMTKKNGLSEKGTAKRNRKTASPLAAETVHVAESSPFERTMAASTGAAGDASSSAVIDPVGVMTGAEGLASDQTNDSGVASANGIKHDDIAALAHSYWVARGRAHGNPEEDWLRAEQELRSRNS